MDAQKSMKSIHVKVEAKDLKKDDMIALTAPTRALFLHENGDVLSLTQVDIFKLISITKVGKSDSLAIEILKLNSSAKESPSAILVSKTTEMTKIMDVEVQVEPVKVAENTEQESENSQTEQESEETNLQA